MQIYLNHLVHWIGWQLDFHMIWQSCIRATHRPVGGVVGGVPSHLRQSAGRAKDRHTGILRCTATFAVYLWYVVLISHGLAGSCHQIPEVNHKAEVHGHQWQK